MQRHHLRSTALAAVSMSAVLVVAACGDKSTSGTPGSSGDASGYSIQALEQIDTDGKVVPQSGDESQAANPAGDGKATCSNLTLAMAGALTGPDAALGINIRNGAQLAVDQHNKANPNCQVKLRDFDTEGDPQKATQVAPTIVADSSIVGLIGPAFSGETKATGDIFNQAGLVATTASATNPDLSGNGWKTFFRGLASDAIQGPAVAKYIVNTLGAKKVCVVQDDTEYGQGLAKTINAGLGDAADKSCAGNVKKGDKDFSAVVAQVNSAKPDAVFYSGYYAEAAPFIKALKAAGVSAKFVSADGTNDPQFVSLAGSDAEGAYLSCPCGPAKDPFKGDYTTAFKQAPGVYSVEAYDLATILLTGIDKGETDRAKLLNFVKNYDGKGLARQYKWNDKGDLATSLIWMYEVKKD